MPSTLPPSSPTPTPDALARTLSRALAAALARHADQAFGLMGNGNAHFIDALARIGLRFVGVRHEAGTVAAADAFTRVSGRLAIATTTYGAGFTNALTPLAEAAQARTPMLVVVGDAPTTGARPWDVDQEMLAAAVGVRTVALAPGRVDEQVDRAAEVALRLRRPVVLAIPYDLADAPVPAGAGARAGGIGIDLSDPAVTRELLAATRPAPANEAGVEAGVEAGAEAPAGTGGAPATTTAVPPETIAEAVAMLAVAERPVVIAGHGARIAGAEAELARIAELLGALTGSTARARGIFSDARHDLGIVGGFGQEDAMAVIAEADAVLVVGAGLNQFTMRFGELLAPEAAVVRVDVEEVSPPRAAHPVSQLLLRGDARAVLRALVSGLEAARPEPSAWRGTVAGLEPGGALRVRDDGLAEHPDGLCADGLLDPRAVAARLAELLPEDRHVTSDGGHFIGWANMFWPVAEPARTVMVGTTYQAIGLGLSTVPGVAAAAAITAPESTVVLTTGDGGGLMALADLETAIRTAPRCVIVVWNDGAYGAEVHLYGEMGLDERAMLIPSADFAGLATALGATGVRVERLPDLDELARWREAGGAGTILLDCRVSRSVVAPYQREVQRFNGLDPR